MYVFDNFCKSLGKSIINSSKAFVTPSYVWDALESGFIMFNNDIHDICNPRKIQVFNLKELQGTTLLGKNSIWNSRN